MTLNRNVRDEVNQLHNVEPNELTRVEGGFTTLSMTSEMPSRDVMCGTMWLMDRIFRR